MRKPVAILSAALLFSVHALAAIDLSPRYIDTSIDGISQRRLFFTDGSRRMSVSVDRETEVSSEGSAPLFRFTKLSSSTFRLMQSPHKPTELFTGPDLERYRATVLRLVPSGVAGQPTIEEETVDVIPVNQWRSYRFVVSWSSGAERIRRSVTFLNIKPDQQIVLQTTAPVKDFDDAAYRSYEIIRTWHEMLPDDVKPATTN